MLLKKLLFSLLFSALIAVSAFITIPIGIVPIVLQNMMVVLTGLLLGCIWGTLSTVIFLILGFMGLPVFSGGGSGIARFIGPTGGFLYGYIVASFISGLMIFIFLRRKKKGFFAFLFCLIAALFGFIFLYPSGIYHYMSYANVDLNTALKVCLIPFIIPDLIKLILCSLIAYKTRPIVNRFLKKETRQKTTTN